jgi:oligopeptide transport system ATP-binding protein
LRALPRLDQKSGALEGIPGNPPNMAHPPAGCPFAPRCADASEACEASVPALTAHQGDVHWLRACHRPVSEMKSRHEEVTHV